ncbi:ABC1 kinase family protein [Pelosinus propionicus]|uniref:2-octaprenylphenol hydroxylase n=1 Tax=Pelosinus propionicus DSM 13327 TaxID=1123291 RepID=A0A1I4JNM7_9FIRM|nr:AarF/ABC1/UbiB kinase family protein [Pelosinus propionicus]SFL67736.1 2-octaprenylphenol hydroxylase [Pelosinus propionicus DSM 13327]
MFAKRVRHLNRYREISTALLSQGFDYIVEETGLIQKVPYYQRFRPVFLKESNGRIAERIRLVLEQLGPTYVKIGQIASTRPDLLPPELIVELEKLQDAVPAFSFTEVRFVLQEELGGTLEEFFQHFEPEPLAAASIGQVHEAVLKSGKTVAVKIQRPSIASDIQTDLEILYELAHLAERRFHWAKTYQLIDMIDEFSKSLRSELDYTSEARNAEKIAKHSTNNPMIYIPKVYWNYSTQKVLTAEYIKGIKISKKEDLKQQGYNLSHLAERFAKEIFHQIFMEGFFHGDPHPGNVIVLPGEIIAFLDFGMVGRLSPEMKYNLSSLVIGLMHQNSDELAKAIFRMGIVPDHVNKIQLREDIDVLKEKYYGIPLSKVSLGEAVSSIFAVALKHKIKIPSDLVLVGKTLLTMEGVIERLDPHLSILDIAEPFGQKLVMERLHPKNLTKTLWKNFSDLSDIFLSLPQHFQEFTSVIKRGRLCLEVAIPEIELILKTQDRISNRLSFSIILLAFSIIMASIIVSLSITGQSSLLWRIPIIEIGFGIAMIMFVWLLYAIIRSGRL